MKHTLKYLSFALALIVLIGVVAACGSKDTPVETTAPETTAPETTAAPVTTNPPVVVGEVPNFRFDVEGNWMGTLYWDPYEGATSYNVYMGYGDERDLIYDHITDTSGFVSTRYAATVHYEVHANGDWYGEETVIAKTAIDGKANGVRVNEMASRDDKMYYYVPELQHEGGGVIWINGEVWVSDGGNGGSTKISEKLMEIRREYLGDRYETYKDDENAKLGVNLYVTHYHGDHVRAIYSVLLNNPYIAIEHLYRGQPEEDPSRRVEDFTWMMNAVYEYRFVRYPGIMQDHVLDWNTPLHIDFYFSSATLDLYPQPFDWSKEYYYENGTPNRMKGYFWADAEKDGDTVNTLVQNCNSMWAIFRYGENTILFTGDSYDVDRIVIQPMFDAYGKETFDTDILVYLHHGVLRYSQLLLDTTTPQYVVFTTRIAKALSQRKFQLNMIYFENHDIPFYWGAMSAFTMTLDGHTITCDTDPVPYDWEEAYKEQ